MLARTFSNIYFFKASVICCLLLIIVNRILAFARIASKHISTRILALKPGCLPARLFCVAGRRYSQVFCMVFIGLKRNNIFEPVKGLMFRCVFFKNDALIPQ